MARSIERRVLDSFELVAAEKFSEAIAHVDGLLEEPELDREDPNVLRMVNNYLIACLHAGEYGKGIAVAEAVQAEASTNPDIFHNAACLYCRVGRLDEAIEQVRLARAHGGRELVSKLERDDDLRAIFGHPGFLAAIAPRARLAPSQRVTIPTDGAASQLFEELGDDELVSVFCTYAEAWGPGAEERVDGVLQRWAEVVEHELEGELRTSVEGFSRGIEVHMTGLPRPREAIVGLLSRLEGLGDPIEIVLMRRTLDEEGAPGSAVEDPALPEMHEAEDEGDFWRHSFDTSLPPPLSEDPAGLFSMIQVDDGSMVAELRPTTLHVPPLRIGYGLLDVEDLPYDDEATRASEVLRKHLARWFHGEVPVVWNKEGEEDGALDRVEREGKRAFAFAIRRDELLTSYATRFRYREQELFFALRDTAKELGLSGVVHWDRGNVFIVNLWE